MKKEMKTLHHLTCHATVHWPRKTAGVLHYAKAKILPLGIFGITSRGGSLILVNRNLLTVPFSTNQFIAVLLLAYCMSRIQKGIKTVDSWFDTNAFCSFCRLHSIHGTDWVTIGQLMDRSRMSVNRKVSKLSPKG